MLSLENLNQFIMFVSKSCYVHRFCNFTGNEIECLVSQSNVRIKNGLAILISCSNILQISLFKIHLI